MSKFKMLLLGMIAFIMTAGAAQSSPISDKYAALGGKGGFLGAATMAEASTPDGVGRYQHYANGSIYWSPATGAHEVRGMIRERWAKLGWENSWLGYPMTDEIDLYDGLGKVTKFQGGQLIWRQSTNAVSEVRSTDLVVDLPTAVGESWKVIQANGLEGDSHVGPFAYCYDLIAGSGPTLGRPLVSPAESRVVTVEQGLDGPDNAGNVVVQRLARGAYSSLLHIVKGSYSKQYGSKLTGISLNWDTQPIPKSGTFLAEAGKTGTKGPHLHFCVTTAPDRPQFGPFESVPVAFRNYDVSPDNVNWKAVTIGVPRRGEYIRRRAGGGGPAAVAANYDTLNYGTVQGQVRFPPGYRGEVGGSLLITVTAPWGEPLGSVKMTLTNLNLTGPWNYKMNKIPDFPNVKVSAVYNGQTIPASDVNYVESGAFNMVGNQTKTVDLILKPEKLAVVAQYREQRTRPEGVVNRQEGSSRR